MEDVREPEALFAYVVGVATDVLNERLTPHDGARQLWQLSREMNALPQALLAFVGLASEWEDHPTARPELEREIVLEMERIRRRFSR